MTAAPHTLVRAHQYLYYVCATPVLADWDYDALCRALGVEGGGGSDRAENYTAEEKDLAEQLLKTPYESLLSPYPWVVPLASPPYITASISQPS